MHCVIDMITICRICRCPNLRKDPFCKVCRTKLRKMRETTVRLQKEVLIRALFAWRRQSPKAFSKLVHGLKGEEQKNLWFELALWMTSQWRTSTAEAKTIIPIPSHQNRNHALGLARAIAHWTGWPLADVLSVDLVRSPQKSLSREARGEVKFQLRPAFESREYRDVILVDDVVTTGATAQAAHKALRQPQRTEMWCLMDRQSCDG